MNFNEAWMDIEKRTQELEDKIEEFITRCLDGETDLDCIKSVDKERIYKVDMKIEGIMRNIQANI